MQKELFDRLKRRVGEKTDIVFLRDGKKQVEKNVVYDKELNGWYYFTPSLGEQIILKVDEILFIGTTREDYDDKKKKQRPVFQSSKSPFKADRIQ